jgi:uncharacterized protein YjdB
MRSLSSRVVRWPSRWSLAVAYVLLSVSCESPLAPSVLRVGRVEVNPAVLELVTGAQATVIARVYDTDGNELAGRPIFWASQNPAVATVSQSGVVTAVSPGTTRIAASSGGESGIVAVTVLQRPVALVRIVPPAASVIAGSSVKLAAELLDATGAPLTGRLVEWSSDDPTVATVSDDGTVTGVAPGGTTVRARAEQKEGSAAVTVLPVPIASIALAPENPVVDVGESLQLQATPRDAAGRPLAGRSLQWTSSDVAVATVSSTGLVTGIAPGSATITVSAPGAGPNGTTPSASVSVTVLLPAVTRVQVIPSGASIQVGATLNFAVNLFDSDDQPLSTAGRTVTWSSSDPTVASINSATGLATGVAVGSTTITADVVTPGRPGSVRGTATLNVSNVPVARVEVTPASATVHVGSTYARRLSATVYDAAGNVLSGRTVVWTSANQSVATVDPASGLVTGISPGTTRIRAVSEGVEGTADVTVDLVRVAAVNVTPPSATLTPPGAVQLVAAPLDSAGQTIGGAALGGRITTWATSNPAVATVSNNGLVTSVAPGVAFITATVDGVQGQSSITVNQVPIATIVVTPSSVQLYPGQSQQLTATALDANGAPLSGRTFTWSSANPAIVSVDPSGRVSGLALGGPVTVTASSEGKSGTASVRVIPRPAAQLAIVTQPDSVAQSGVPLGRQPVVRLVDDLGGPVSQAGVTVTAEVASGAGGVSAGNVATTDGSGVATFSGLAITGQAGPYTLRFSANGMASVTSAVITLGAGGPTRLALLDPQPASTASGAVLAPPPLVELRDASGNPVAQAGIAVSVELASGSGSLGGKLTVSTGADGRAVFDSVTVSGPVPGPVVLRFKAPGLADALSSSIGITPGTPVRLDIEQQPSPLAVNDSIFTQQPQIRLRDGAGNLVPQAAVKVQAELVSGNGVLLGTDTVRTDSNGRATFSNLKLRGRVGNYRLRFTSGTLLPDTGEVIRLDPGVATQLAILRQPDSVSNSLLFEVEVQLRDVSGNDVPQQGVQVSAALQTGDSVLAGRVDTLTGPSGLARFTGLRIVGPVGPRTLRFSSGTLAPAVSATIFVKPGPPRALSFLRPPPATASSGANFDSVVVQVRDTSGNDVPQAGLAVTASIASGSSGATLSGNVVSTDALGRAVFRALTLTGPAGQYTLAFQSPGLIGVISGPIDLGAGTGAKLAILLQPSLARNSLPFGQQPIVQLQDASGNPVAQSGVVVTADIAEGGGDRLGTWSATTGADGRAIFSDLAIVGQVGTRRLIFAASGYISILSDALLLTAGPAKKLLLVTPPSSSARAGVQFQQQPAVQVADTSDNAVTGSDGNGRLVTAAIATGGGTLGGTVSVTTGSDGRAAFTNLSIGGTVGARTLSFSTSGLTPANANVNVTFGPAAQIAIDTAPPATARNGVPFSTRPVARVKDAYGNDVAGDTVTVSIASGGGTLSGTTTAVTDAQGRAAFPNLAITGTTGTRTLRFATAGGSLSVVSGNVELLAGPPTQIEMVDQPPSSTPNGATFSAKVRVRDQSANAVPGITVTAAIDSGAPALGGTTSVTTAADGTATFNSLLITGVTGTRKLRFTATGGSNPSVVSAPVDVTAGVPANLTIQTQPPAQVPNATFFGASVSVTDQSGNPVPNTSVTTTIASGAGQLSGTTVKTTNASGIATFDSLMIVGSTGNRTLRFTAAGGSAPQAVSTTVNVVPGSPKQIVIDSQPPAVVQNGVPFRAWARLADTSGNLTAQQGIAVTASIASGAGTLAGNTVVATDASGIAKFDSLVIVGTTGTRTLSFSSTGLTPAVSQSVSVQAGPPRQIAITTPPPATVASGATFTVTVQVSDTTGNPVSGVAVQAAIASGGGTLGGTTSVTTGPTGNATFNLSIGGTVGARTLSFSTSGLTPANANVNVTFGPAAQIAIDTAPPATAQNGVPFSTRPVARVKDAYGNDVAGDTVTVSIASGGGTLSGTTTAVTDAQGRAAFPNLAITGTTGTRTLRFATAGGSLSVVSGNVELLAGPPTQIEMVDQPPSSTPNGATFSAKVRVRDQSANAVPGITVTAAIDSGAPALGGTTSVTTAADGTATFNSLLITGVTGTRKLRFTATGGSNPSVVSAPVDVTAGVPANLTIQTQPPAQVPNATFFGASVSVTDQSGNPVPNTSVTTTIASGAGQLSGTTVKTTNASGIATFDSLMIVGSTGNRTLRFTAAGGSAPQAVSTTVNVVPGSPKQIVIDSQPPAVVQNGVPFRAWARLADTSGNLTAQQGIAVTASIASGAGTLAGNTVVATDASGIAKFDSLVIVGTTGTRTLSFSSTGLTPAVSQSVSVQAGPPRQIAITTPPPATVASGATFTVTVQVSDTTGNPVSGVAVQAAIASGGGTLGGTTSVTTGPTGNATFNLSITGTAGVRTLRFTASGGSNPEVVTGDIDVTAGAATKLTIETQPPTTAQSGSTLSPAPVVRLRDAADNFVNQSNVTVRARLASGNGTLQGDTVTTTDSNGAATFGNLAIAGTVGNYTIRFVAAGLDSATSNTIALSAGAASQLVIVIQPSDTAASGTPFARQPEIQLRDAAGNDVAQSDVAVTVTIETGPGGASLIGTTTQNTNAAGKAVFSGLGISGPAGTYTLKFSATLGSSTVNVISAAVVISP